MSGLLCLQIHALKPHFWSQNLINLGVVNIIDACELCGGGGGGDTVCQMCGCGRMYKWHSYDYTINTGVVLIKCMTENSHSGIFHYTLMQRVMTKKLQIITAFVLLENKTQTHALTYRSFNGIHSKSSISIFSTVGVIKIWVV